MRTGNIKNIILITTCFLILFSSCLPESTENRIYIKSIQIDSLNSIDWYITSLIGGYSRSTIILVTKNKEEEIIKSHGITNINIDKRKKLVFIESTDELEKFGEGDTLNISKNYKVVFNTKGFYMNNGEGRLSRLKSKGVNISIPHYENSDF